MKLSVGEKDSKGIEDIESFNRVTKGETIEPVVLNAKYLNSIRGQIQGIDIPLLNGVLQSMYIVPLPEDEFNCDIVSIKMDKRITGNFKRYMLKDRIIIVLESYLFRLTWVFNLINGYILKNEKSTINIKMKTNKRSYEDEIEETQVLIDWLTGKEVRIYKQNNYKWNVPLPIGKCSDINEFVNELIFRNKIIRNIVNVRRYFGVDFNSFNSINGDEVELLERLNKIGKTRKLKLESISLKLSDISFLNESGVDTFERETIFLLECEIPNNEEVKLLGESIILGNSKIKCKDAYISNYDEIKNKTVDKLIIKSKRDKLFIQYY
ncbi:hypothetical protein [Clostridium botulinum]|uniref:hypothetical protein n=2 Tax=Clostridium botulinum TaxID=1491 RepID=UPI000774031D|nr:hypothetical protein [Clostridium botulinum]MBY6951044.1 hypothetical protein [Clostridium botulinum]MCR1140294.1 hypothetical protein [Clostridium botulinum]NEZ79945.1 hypothetical protein [Clostridium botulinum]NFA17960.1 hypothetical protein [Clostridium botulinum]NFA54515.1 hypothetical protein [Clostridium botulinum]